MQDPRVDAGGARRKHLGHRGRRPQLKVGRRGHAGVRAGEGDAGTLPSGCRTRHDQAGAVPGRVRRSLLPGLQVSGDFDHSVIEPPAVHFQDLLL